MLKDAFRSLGVILGVSFLAAAVMRLSGIVEDFSSWWGIFAVLILPPLIGWFLKKHFEMTGKIVSVIIGLVYLVVAAAILPVILEYFARKAPFTSEALTHRGINTDLQAAKAMRPWGVARSIAQLRHCSEREAQLAQWEADELTQVRKNLTDGKIKLGGLEGAEAQERNIIKWKRDNHSALMKNCAPNDTPGSTRTASGNASSWLPSLPDFRNLLPAGVPLWLVGIALLVIAIFGLVPKKFSWLRKAVAAVGLILLIPGIWQVVKEEQEQNRLAAQRAAAAPQASQAAAQVEAALLARPPAGPREFTLMVANATGAKVKVHKISGWGSGVPGKEEDAQLETPQEVGKYSWGFPTNAEESWLIKDLKGKTLAFVDFPRNSKIHPTKDRTQVNYIFHPAARVEIQN